MRRQANGAVFAPGSTVNLASSAVAGPRCRPFQAASHARLDTTADSIPIAQRPCSGFVQGAFPYRRGDQHLAPDRNFSPPRRRAKNALPSVDPRALSITKGSALSRQESVGEEERSEHVKPLNGIQLVQIQPGQRRSGRAGSESCTCVGRPAR